MNRLSRLRLGAALALALVSATAFAHAQLDHAAPGVGATVAASPDALTLYFTEGVEPHFSGVTLTNASGAAQPLGALTVDPSHPSVVTLKLDAPLKPGVYTVAWHVVSVDTHKTQGNFTFTVAP